MPSSSVCRLRDISACEGTISALRSSCVHELQIFFHPLDFNVAFANHPVQFINHPFRCLPVFCPLVGEQSWCAVNELFLPESYLRRMHAVGTRNLAVRLDPLIASMATFTLNSALNCFFMLQSYQILEQIHLYSFPRVL